jgi:hypothetical protein
MIKEPTLTIYDCLGPAFWTKRKCLNCQCFFTILDWEQQNHQLTFKEIGQVKSTTSLNYAVLEGVIVQLSHKSCCSDCTSYLQDLKKNSPFKTNY